MDQSILHRKCAGIRRLGAAYVRSRIVFLGLVCAVMNLFAAITVADDGIMEAKIHVNSGHPWRPPFGLERVGRPLTVTVEIASDKQLSREYWLAGYLDGRETDRRVLQLTGMSPYNCHVSFDRWPTEVALFASSGSGDQPTEIVRRAIDLPEFEAEAIAQPDTVMNPVDLGTILPPSDWLLLGPDQQVNLDLAAISRNRDIPAARLRVWFESAPGEEAAAELPLTKGRLGQHSLLLPPPAPTTNRDVLHLSISDGTTELWHKTIQTMLVQETPQWPEFGATETKLRYDAPISVRAEDGALSSMDYSTAWDAHLNDVVVSLPNGARFVFWRGASYIPFWAGRHNTGLCYEWAETPPPEGFTDCVEPLMDKELRYGRVQILESTVARVHVRWSYQSCDFHYKVWGDSATEDYYFYPDGLGTRVLDLKTEGEVNYELSEFIILTPPATYPFSVLPAGLVDFLFMDGEKREISFPYFPAEQGEKLKPRGIPVVYRIRLNKQDPLTAIYFNPNDTHLPIIFGPFHDQGQVVTPVYWGNHWPLARGRTTTRVLDKRIHLTPAHNSVMTWGFEQRPQPVRTTIVDTLDALGRSKRMNLTRWVWTIGMTDVDDERLLEWAHSISSPPGLDLHGARLAIDSYVPERRAFRLIAEDAAISITINPKMRCVNPVFEVLEAPGDLMRATLDGRILEHREYRWDGQTLWLETNIDEPTALQLQFRNSLRD